MLMTFHVVLLRCWWNCSGFLSPFLDFIFEPPISFAMPRVFKWSNHFCHHQKQWPQFKVFLNLKRGSHFVFAKIGQTTYEKSRKMQGSRILVSWNFSPCGFFPKILLAPFLFKFKQKRGTFHFWEFFSAFQLAQPIFAIPK